METILKRETMISHFNVKIVIVGLTKRAESKIYLDNDKEKKDFLDLIKEN